MSHSSGEIFLVRNVSTCHSSIFSCGTDYSALEGMVWRYWPKTRNSCRVPRYGPAKPKARSLRMKSRLLVGCHPAVGALVQVDAGELWQFVSETEADENPILECGAKLVFAVLAGFAKADYARQLRYFTGEAAILELLVTTQFQRGFNVGGQRKRHGPKLADSAAPARIQAGRKRSPI